MKYVDLVCVGGPNDGHVIRVKEGFSHRLLFPVRRKLIAACTPGPIVRENLQTAEYMISWRTGNAYFDGINT